ncbi:methyltransferase domain-containing protein [Parasphingopyxis marina]|uniref:Methyltransferase domain-containing protein n=1 Tax=Parasphingopyxis marina TaxID=2761622 RepID=A0A842HVD7_9SPHN|nr:methyltransferase domain-containing protein [Parasphingopyxis marina]MBC2776473.1 methyltransferase domain-containing protein [Parasphingopyxis marina]
MSDADTGQVTASAAEIYDTFFLPALFQRWAAPVCEAADIRPGDHVLDVACGTGVLALEAKRRAGDGGIVRGLDCNAGMLAVARGASADIVWDEGRAEALPFADNSLDAVVSQFGLMFFEDRGQALAEMWRVLRPGGRLAAAVWAGLERVPGYMAMVTLLDRLFGAETADALYAPYCLGDEKALARLFAAAGIADAQVTLHGGPAIFPSVASWVHTDIRGWTLADAIDDAQFARLLAEAETEFRDFVAADGTVSFAHPALIVTASKPG